MQIDGACHCIGIGHPANICPAKLWCHSAMPWVMDISRFPLARAQEPALR